MSKHFMSLEYRLTLKDRVDSQAFLEWGYFSVIIIIDSSDNIRFSRTMSTLSSIK